MIENLTRPEIMSHELWEHYLSKITETLHGWMWIGGKSHGYGRFWIPTQQKYFPAHRLMFEAANGYPPVNVIDHTCNIPLCVTPRCLDDVTQAENIRRMWERGRGSASAIQSDFCVNGHRFDKIVKGSSGNLIRSCSICRRDSVRRHRAAKRA